MSGGDVTGLDFGVAGGPVGEPGVEGFEKVAGGVFDGAGCGGARARMGADVGGEVQKFGGEGAEVFVGDAGVEVLDGPQGGTVGREGAVAEVPGGGHVGAAAVGVRARLNLKDETPLPVAPEKPDVAAGFEVGGGR